jgi:pSer/pThr/pTyr-binding forkhead associated (FHA) protein
MAPPRLFIKFNMAVIKELTLEKDEYTFGRKTSNDIVLDNPAVSGAHGKLKKEGKDYVVYDLNSTNGTFLNGRKVSKETLKNKDQIRIARYVMEFASDEIVLHRGDEQFVMDTPVIESNEKPAETEKQIDILRQSMGLPTKGEAPKPELIKNEPVASAVPEPAPVAEVKEQMGAHLKGDRPLPPASGVVKIISGAADDRMEYKLTELSTYIGTANQALIKIKGFMAPDLAAAISRRPEGYFLKAVKSGYPKVNGVNVKDQIFLESGALIEVGGTNMVFYVNDPSKNGSK